MIRVSTEPALNTSPAMPLPTAGERGSLPAIGLWALCALAFSLPFEWKDPLFRIGPVGVTSVEFMIYLVLGVWLTFRLAGRGQPWNFMHTAVAGWAVILIVSAFAAPQYRPDCIKFALRSCQGCALCFAAADFVRTPRAAAKAASFLVIGSCISALAGQAEVWLPAAAAWLGHFKTGPSLSGSYLRASGTFQYANIASMYWEATLPLALVLPFLNRHGQQPVRWGVRSTALALILINAILIATSRAGILIAALMIVTAWFAATGAMLPFRTAANAAAVAFLLLLCVHLSGNDLLRLRFTSLGTSSWYKADYANLPARLTLEAGKPARVPMTVHNAGRLLWKSKGAQSVQVSYHWLDSTGTKVLVWNGARTELPGDIRPGGSQDVRLWVTAPAKPGNYRLQWDMLQEDVAWFSVFAPGSPSVPVLILPSNAAGTPSDLKPTAEYPLPQEPQRRDLWRAALRLWRQAPVLGVGPDNFRRLKGPLLEGMSADPRVYANNLYLELLADTGVIGLLAFLLVGVTAGRLSLVTWKKMSRVSDRMLVAALVFSLGAYYLHGVLDYFLAFTPTYGLFWLLMGIVGGLYSGTTQP